MLPKPVIPGLPVTALAPMQDVTDLPFMRVIAGNGAPDYFVTEYFRVHVGSTLEKYILRSITENDSGRPVYAQIMGDDLDLMANAARELQRHPVAGVDLNMGCPAPKVYRKNAGGGLLRDANFVDLLLGRLREACTGLFTVKMRLGFEDDKNFETFLALVAKHKVDLLTVHGRTVREMYRSEVRYPRIRDAVSQVPCPVMANGNVSTADKAVQVVNDTGCYGVMIGRAAIRNPWIFAQTRARFLEVYGKQKGVLLEAEAPGTVPALATHSHYPRPTFRDLRGYIEQLWNTCYHPGLPDTNRVNRMKKYLNFIGLAVDPEGTFLYESRRTILPHELFAVCDRHLLHNDRQHLPFPEEPYSGLVARPSREAALETCSF
ncbi:MAG: tRNA-dihydrouridine synthase family protein [Verrucomicrobiota bacterium]|nr:tRNA-dihydrouridine synthase family protein [Verrucomicrobiota bacterium]